MCPQGRLGTAKGLLQSRVPKPDAFAVKYQLFFKGYFRYPIQTEARRQRETSLSLVETLTVAILDVLFKRSRERL